MLDEVLVVEVLRLEVDVGENVVDDTGVVVVGVGDVVGVVVGVATIAGGHP